MCTDPIDPRDAVSEATSALLCLMLLVSSSAESTVHSQSLASSLRLVLDRLEPAAEELANYVPRG